jgi:isopenicillin N synthase-like dioxygenase
VDKLLDWVSFRLFTNYYEVQMDDGSRKRFTQAELSRYADEFEIVGFSQAPEVPLVHLGVLFFRHEIAPVKYFGSYFVGSAVYRRSDPVPVYRTTSQAFSPLPAIASLRANGSLQIALDEAQYAVVKRVLAAATQFYINTDMEANNKYYTKFRVTCTDGTKKWVGYASPWMTRTDGSWFRKNRRWFQFRAGMTSFVVKPGEDAIYQEFEEAALGLFALQKQLAQHVYLGLISTLPEAADRERLSMILDDRDPEDLKDQGSFGADVLRIYQMYSDEFDKQPSMYTSATPPHSDFGLLTLSPSSTIPSLRVYSEATGRWVKAEADQPANTMNVYAGDCLAKAMRGVVRAGLHCVVEEFPGQMRLSCPFFLRGKPDFKLTEDNTVREYMEGELMVNRYFRTPPKYVSSEY